MKPLKLLLTALALIPLSYSAYSQDQTDYRVQTSFIDTFIGPFETFHDNQIDAYLLYGGITCTELKDSGFAIFVGNNELTKTDKNGKILWGVNSMVTPTTQLFNLFTDKNGNIVIVSQLGAEKFDYKTGAVIYNASFAQVANTISIQSVSPSSDGGFFIGGPINYGNYISPGLAKIDSTGNQVWFNIYSINYFYLNNIIGDNENGALMVFSNMGLNGPDSLYMIKVNSSGNIEWQNRYQTETNDSGLYRVLNVIENPTDNSIALLTGNQVYPSPTSSNLGFLKFDGNGKLLSSISLPYLIGNGNLYLINNNYVIVGETEAGVAYLPIDNTGTVQDIKYYPLPPDFQMTQYVSGSSNCYALAQSIIPIEDTGIVISGFVAVTPPYNGEPGSREVDLANYLMKYTNENAPPQASFLVYPNPTLTNLSITTDQDQPNALIKIYNLLGQQLFNAPVSLLQNTPQTIDLPGLANGIYLITLQTGDELVTKKFIKL